LLGFLWGKSNAFNEVHTNLSVAAVAFGYRKVSQSKEVLKVEVEGALFGLG
jgi:hypothetical protein